MKDVPFGPGHVEYCPKSKDAEPGTHCDHWWDGEEDAEGNLVGVPCCWCGSNEGEIG